MNKLFILLAILFSYTAAAVEFKQNTLNDSLERPWGMVFISPHQLLITEKAGQLKLLDLNTPAKTTLIQGLPNDVYSGGQGGLFDIKLAGNGWLYFTYSKAINGDDKSKGATTLARAKLAGSQLKDWQDLLVTDSAKDSGRHYGSRIAFDGKGNVFFGVGDRGNRPQAQNLTNHIGSLMRVTLEGKPNPGNPFYNSANAKPEIYSYGHRNPQGLAIDADGQLWEIEHGPRGGDEINRIEAGKNYGWPVISHGQEYSRDEMVGEATAKDGMEQAAKVYVPSIAPSSLMIYSGKAFPQWQGQFFAGALALSHINRLSRAKDGKLIEQERMLEDLGERIRYVSEGPQGYIYVLTDSGKLLQLKP